MVCMFVCVRERKREAYVCERAKGREREKEREWYVCMCVGESERKRGRYVCVRERKKG